MSDAQIRTLVLGMTTELMSISGAVIQYRGAEPPQMLPNQVINSHRVVRCHYCGTKAASSRCDSCGAST